MNVQKLINNLRNNMGSKSSAWARAKERFARLITLKYKGKMLLCLSPALIVKQGIGEKEILTLKRLHLKRIKMFEKMKKLKSRKSLLPYVKKLENLEFAMQKAWRFEQNRDFHTWWYQAPHCKCPKMDNADSFGTGQRIYSSECILHWDSSKLKLEKEEKDLVCISFSAPKEKKKVKSTMKEACKECSYRTKKRNAYYKCFGSKGCPAASGSKKR